MPDDDLDNPPLSVVRMVALHAAAVVVATKSGWSSRDAMKLADEYANYIVTGKIPDEPRR